jgi:cellulose synthase/poly-beta-1,6-N-acetylglucosamine synthase-like glycosyltransferase
MLLSFCLPAGGVPRRRTLQVFPKVAVLYVTCNDACPPALESLSLLRYPELDIFILDDSSDPGSRALLEKYPYTLVRRPSRQGYKAGNLNNWLEKYGADYKYFAVMDSDSILPPDFILNMVKVAEHPQHNNIAFFQSKPLIWNRQNHFTRTMAIMNEVLFFPVRKLANSCELILSWGHNDLVRTKVILANGGYNEKFISEDFATSLDILKMGYGCLFVDLVSFEALPGDFRSFARRVVRWAKSTLQIFLYHPKHQASFFHKYGLLMNTHSFVSWFFYLPGMLISIWAFQTSLLEIQFLANSGFGWEWHSVITLGLLGFYMLTFIFLKFLLAKKHGVTLAEYFRHLFLNICLSYYLAMPVIWGQCQVLLGQSITFDITSKKQERIGLLQIFLESKIMLLLTGMILLGAIWFNPLGGLFSFLWLLPLLVYPFVLLHYSNDGV